MPIPWATVLYRGAVYPAIYAHSQYWRRKVLLDRFLETRRPVTNIAIGATVGAALYFLLVPLRPSPVDKNQYQLADDFSAMLQTMRVDPTVELPAMALVRIRELVVARVLSANDAAAVRQMERDVERLKQASSPTSPMRTGP